MMYENEFHEIIEIVSKIGELIMQMRNEYKIFEKKVNLKPEENHFNQELCGFFIKNNYQLK